MQTAATHANSVRWNSKEFQRGLVAGLQGRDRRYDLSQCCNEGVIVEMVRSMCERATDGELDHSHLLYDSGLLVGYVLAST
jgi:hypothetical protein